MPSRPAIRHAAKLRYGLHDGSGIRNSRRRAAGLSEIIGMRIHAERLRAEYTRLIGASYPGTRRRYEFIEGAANAKMEGQCLSSPPMYQRMRSLIVAYLPLAS